MNSFVFSPLLIVERLESMKLKLTRKEKGAILYNPRIVSEVYTKNSNDIDIAALDLYITEIPRLFGSHGYAQRHEAIKRIDIARNCVPESYLSHVDTIENRIGEFL